MKNMGEYSCAIYDNYDGKGVRIDFSKLVAEVNNVIRNMSYKKIIKLHNEYVKSMNEEANLVYLNTSEFVDKIFEKPSDLFKASLRGYNTSHLCAFFKDGQLISTNFPLEDRKCPIDTMKLARYIIDKEKKLSQ